MSVLGSPPVSVTKEAPTEDAWTVIGSPPTDATESTITSRNVAVLVLPGETVKFIGIAVLDLQEEEESRDDKVAPESAASSPASRPATRTAPPWSSWGTRKAPQGRRALPHEVRTRAGPEAPTKRAPKDRHETHQTTPHARTKTTSQKEKRVRHQRTCRQRKVPLSPANADGKAEPKNLGNCPNPAISENGRDPLEGQRRP